ncbi:MAG: hypothetical protein N4A35_11800 [Flavobacteriales bacterium]|jgi:hypothetical protein|nr:hypothetical protein [Flavobacteriales bacterium]
MNKTIHPYQLLYIFGLPLLIITGMVVLAKSTLFLKHPEQLAVGITLDLVFTAPLLYFLLIRKKAIPNTTVVPLFILGVVITSFIIPKDYQNLLLQVKYWVVPIVEISVVALTIYKIRQIRKAYKAHHQDISLDFYTTLKTSTAAILPKRIGMLLVTEIAVIYYAFINWKKQKLATNEFTYHKHSSVIALLAVFIFLALGETAILHYLIQKWNGVVAWVLTIISIYTALQLFGILRSMRKRPIVITDEKLYLRHGIFSETTIALDQIESFEQSSKSIVFDEQVRRLSPLGELTNYNYIIHLKSPQTLVGLYGLKKHFTTLAFHVDDKRLFHSSLSKKIQNQK